MPKLGNGPYPTDEETRVTEYRLLNIGPADSKKEAERLRYSVSTSHLAEKLKM